MANEMEKWEYTSQRNPNDSDLNIMGRMGWEAYAVTAILNGGFSNGVNFYFKRRVNKGGIQ